MTHRRTVHRALVALLLLALAVAAACGRYGPPQRRVAPPAATPPAATPPPAPASQGAEPTDADGDGVADDFDDGDDEDAPDGGTP